MAELNITQKRFVDGKWVNVYPETTASQVRTDAQRQFVTSEEKEALAGKEDSANKGKAGGYAALDNAGRVPMEQMPAVLEHNKGYFADEAALREALPTARAGDFAIVGATDTVWIWDADGDPAKGWIDSSTPGAVISVNGKTGAVTVSWDDLTAPDAATNAKGVVQLSSSTDSASETEAATPKAVKAVMDAVEARPKVTFSSVAPENPAEGDFWLDTTAAT